MMGECEGNVIVFHPNTRFNQAFELLAVIVTVSAFEAAEELRSRRRTRAPGGWGSRSGSDGHRSPHSAWNLNGGQIL